MLSFEKMKGKRKAVPSEKAAVAKKAAGSDPRLPDYMQKEYEKAPAPHITDFPDLVDILPDLAIECRQVMDAIRPLEARKKELVSDINALLDAVGQKRIRGDGWLAIYIEGGYTERVIPERLLALGLTMTQIEEATERKPKAGHVEVRKGE